MSAYERGLILFGGYDQSLSKYNTTQMYLFQGSGAQIVKKCNLNENSLPTDGSTLTFTQCLTSFAPTSADGNILTVSATGYGNYLYYNTSNNQSSSIKRVQMF